MFLVKPNGKKLGKPPIQYPDNWKEVYTVWKSGAITAREAMKRMNLKTTSFYQLAKNYKSKKNSQIEFEFGINLT